ncbi:hypothetical protein GCM10027037_15270 [Mucilaginibacter koreensis]
MSKVFTIAEGLENLGAMKTGGQGSVYKGRRQATIFTAVKLLPTPVLTQSDDDKNYRNFQNEVQKLHKVNEQASPYVVKILSSGLTESGSFPYIEMEYIEGPDLCELLQDPNPKVFPVREVIKLADQLASALAHCHKVGVQHGDIKSNNVRYNTRSGNYVLLDFGLALMSEEQRRTSMRHAGAIEFMAPEQSRGEMLPQTDIYGYGIILYELLAGQVPFPLADHSEAARNQVMLAHMETPVPDLLELRKTHLTEELRLKETRVPSWLLNVISKCLSKDPMDRYANGMELQEAVISGSLAAAEAALSGTVPVPQSSIPQPITSGAAEPGALLQENERLQNLVNQYQQEKQDMEQDRISEFSTSRVYMSRPVFTGLIALLIIFMVFSGYALFFKRQGSTGAETGADTTATQQTDTAGTGNTQAPQMESNYNNSAPPTDTESKPAVNNAQQAIDSVIKRNRELQRKRQNQDTLQEETGDSTSTSTAPSTDESADADVY